MFLAVMKFLFYAQQKQRTYEHNATSLENPVTDPPGSARFDSWCWYKFVFAALYMPAAGPSLYNGDLAPQVRQGS
jgi:hypothetical protein